MSTALIVFAKAPVPGQAKTRLIPALGAEGAARLAEQLLQHTLRQVRDAPVDHLALCVAPDTHHPVFEQARQAVGERLHLAPQGDGDLGERMHRALSRALARHHKALLIGTDAPALNAQVLAAAGAALDSHDAVFVPALDGGYALIGLTRPAPELLLGMAWSTPQVMEHTRERARRHGWRWAELAPVADIDEAADLVHLPAGWPSTHSHFSGDFA
ncbi:MAG: TIGR04282 family arsenosugar biosynthesis glycosyltransferase [Hydrogenophaga sp.]|nr:TIGR04282 family arsenosugar biosynthesis glycosyltransferase [Hydrogenophaga sp.]